MGNLNKCCLVACGVVFSMLYPGGGEELDASGVSHIVRPAYYPVVTWEALRLGFAGEVLTQRRASLDGFLGVETSCNSMAYSVLWESRDVMSDHRLDRCVDIDEEARWAIYQAWFCGVPDKNKRYSAPEMEYVTIEGILEIAGPDGIYPPAAFIEIHAIEFHSLWGRDETLRFIPDRRALEERLENEGEAPTPLESPVDTNEGEENEL